MPLRAIVSSALGILGVIVGQKYTLPFSVDHALTIQPFFIVGLIFRKWKYEDFSLPKCTIGILGWVVPAIIIIILCPGQKFEISQRMFPLFPLCFAMASFAMLSVCEFCKYFESITEKTASAVKSFITKIGRDSIWLFGVHHMDGMWRNIYSLSGNNFIQILLRLMCDVVIMLIALQIWHFIKERSTKTKYY